MNPMQQCYPVIFPNDRVKCNIKFIICYSSHFVLFSSEARESIDYKNYLRRGMAYFEAIVDNASNYILDRLSESAFFDLVTLSYRRPLSIKRGTVLMVSAGFLAACIRNDFFGLQWLIDAADPTLVTYAKQINDGIKQISSVSALSDLNPELRNKIKLSSTIDYRSVVHAQRSDTTIRKVRLLSKRAQEVNEAPFAVHFWDERSFSETVPDSDVSFNNEESQFFAVRFPQIFALQFEH